MPDPLLPLPPLLQNGVAAQSPAETVPEGPDTEATGMETTGTETTGTEVTVSPLRIPGSDDAAVCTDGVCVL